MDSRRELMVKAAKAALEVDAALGARGTIDEHGVENQDSAQALHVGSTEGVAQSFELTSPVSVPISSLAFNMARQGSPPGSVTAAVYAATGTHGTDARPTGSALATAPAVAVSTLPEAPDFDFTTFILSSEVELAAGTYCAALLYDDPGSDISNHAQVGMESQDDNHPGNRSRLKGDGSWVALSGEDLVFLVTGRVPMTKPAGLNVHRHLGRSVNQSDLPDIIIADSGEDPSEIGENTTDQSKRIVELVTLCRALAAPDKTADESLDPVRTWAEIALLSDYTLGGLAAEGHFAGSRRVSTEEFSESFAQVAISFQFTILTKWGDPRQAP